MTDPQQLDRDITGGEQVTDPCHTSPSVDQARPPLIVRVPTLLMLVNDQLGRACIWGRCNGTIGSDGRCNRCGSRRS